MEKKNSMEIGCMELNDDDLDKVTGGEMNQFGSVEEGYCFSVKGKSGLGNFKIKRKFPSDTGKGYSYEIEYTSGDKKGKTEIVSDIWMRTNTLTLLSK